LEYRLQAAGVAFAAFRLKAVLHAFSCLTGLRPCPNAMSTLHRATVRLFSALLVAHDVAHRAHRMQQARAAARFELFAQMRDRHIDDV